MIPPAVSRLTPGLTAAAAVLVLTVALALWVHIGTGQLAYPLDDTYIHLAVARNVTHGTWALWPGEFTSSSTSPAWTLLLAVAMLVAGARVSIALVLATVAAVGTPVVLDAGLERRGVDRPVRWGAGLSVLLLGPMAILAVLGMEHALHVLCVVGLLSLLDREDARWQGVAAVSALAVLTRPETVFMAGPLAVALFAERRGRHAVAMLAAVALPVGLGMALSVVMGGLPVPNSLIMKSALVSGIGANAAGNLAEGWPLLVVAMALGAVARRDDLVPLAWAATIGIHLVFGAVGWYYRYEAYLIVGAVYLLGCRVDTSRLAPVLTGIAALSLIPRSLDAHRYLQGRSQYIYDAKVVPAEALASAAPELPVAAHDIGALAWYAPNDVVDLAGLGTNEVARMHWNRRLDVEIGPYVSERGSAVALVVPGWMLGQRPEGWKRYRTLRWRHGERAVQFDVDLLDADRAGEVAVWMAEIIQRSPRMEAAEPAGAHAGD